MNKQEKKKMEMMRRERISNRLVLNFGVLLLASFVLLYVYKFFTSGYAATTSTVMLVVAIVCAVGAIAFLVLGKTKLPKIKNYSAIFAGTMVVSFIYWFATTGYSLALTHDVQTTSYVMLPIWIVAAVATIALIVLGKKKNSALTDYAFVSVGVFLVSFLFWLVTFYNMRTGQTLFSTDVTKITIGIYIAMAVYFIILAIVSAVQTHGKKDKDKE